MTVRRSRRSAFLLLAGSLALAQLPAGSAFAQANNDFFGNLFKPPGQVRSGNQAPPDADEGGTVSTRIDRLENQLRQITGQLEQLQYRNQQLEQQVRQLQSEIDFRLGGAGGGGGPAPAAGAAPRAPAAAPGGVAPIMEPAPSRRSDAFDPSAQAGAPGAPRPLGTTQPSGDPDEPMDLGALSGQVAAGGASAEPAARSNSPKDLFDLAYGHLLRQDYAQSGQSFEQFLKLYPNDRAAPDAYYWLGETQFQRRTYKEAAQNFLKVSTDYPNAVKAPDALLRLGQSLAAIGEKDAACATLNAVNNKYPRASATIKQGVEREQKRAGC